MIRLLGRAAMAAIVGAVLLFPRAVLAQCSNESNPTVIGSVPFVAVGNTAGACNDISFSCELGGTSNGPDVWYELTVTERAVATITTDCGISGGIDSRLAVIDVFDNQLYCNDDDLGCGDGASAIRDAYLAPGTYYIVVDSAFSGNYVLRVDLEEPPAFGVEDLLPDIIVRTSDLHDNDIRNIQGVPHIRLSNGTANVGTGALYLYGIFPDNGDGTQDVVQRVWRTDGSFYDRLAGQFIYHTGHGHIHLDDWAEYRLREVLPEDGVGAILTEGQKTSFCVLDLGIHDSTLPNHNPSGQFFSCGSSIQGLSVGWVDIYSKGLADQNIDISGIADGTYWLESVVDPTGSFEESNEANNAARVKIVIGSPGPINPDGYEPNDNTSQVDALPVGAINSPNLGPCAPDCDIASLNVDAPGDDDFYRFYLPTTGGTGDRVRIEFNDDLGDLDMRLLSAGGSQLDISSGSGNTETISLDGMPAGWYYAEIFGYNSATNPNYRLMVEPPANGAPQITVMSPAYEGAAVRQGIDPYTVNWSSSDPEGNPTWVTVYLNTTQALDGSEILVPTSLNTDGNQGFSILNTAEFPQGIYYVYCAITDGGTMTGAWSQGTLQIADQATSIPEGGVAPGLLSRHSVSNHPNPFNPATTLRLTLPAPSHVRWRIHDVRGALVRTLLEGSLSAGVHERSWDGSDDSGRSVASGVYYQIADGPGFFAREKVVLLK